MITVMKERVKDIIVIMSRLSNRIGFVKIVLMSFIKNLVGK